MAKKYMYYLVTEDGDVLGTNDREVVSFAGSDGTTLVIDVAAGVTTFDDNKATIEEAEPADWQDEDAEEDEDA